MRTEEEELRARLTALAREAERKGEHLRGLGLPDLSLVGNAYVGMGQRIRAALDDEEMGRL